ncbi:hypothetical protein B0H13DRAFT_1865564 [Mycena leptocephala]|nr:hypothetical protein B0H13DRAFT_1865564 [Mycena leptocephala]
MASGSLQIQIVDARDEEQLVTISFSGNTVNNGSADARSAIALLYGTDDDRNLSGALPVSMEQSTDGAELAAALVATQRTAKDVPMLLESSRDTVLKAMSKTLDKNEDRGWIGTKNRDIAQALSAELRVRTAPTILAVRRDGRKCEEASGIARTAARDPVTQPITINCNAPKKTHLAGAKLSTLTQALAYKGIKETYKKVSRKATNENVGLVQDSLRAQYSHAPTASTIWKSLRHKDITRQIQTFLWKSMHGAHRIGKFWKNIPECEDRATCDHCQETENLEHILLGLWKLAEEFWAKKHPTWPPLSMGSILGCGMAIFEDKKKRPHAAKARLYRILITESMYLIWKLRCECVIGHNGEPPTANEIHNRWVHTINERLEIDKNLTNELKFGKQYILPRKLVLDAWRGTLHAEKDLPRDWLNKAEVLASIGSRRPPSPNEGVG